MVWYGCSFGLLIFFLNIFSYKYENKVFVEELIFDLFLFWINHRKKKCYFLKKKELKTMYKRNKGTDI